MGSVDLNSLALKEYLEIAEYCLSKVKEDRTGVFGFPAAVLLLSFIDGAGYLLFIKGTGEDDGCETPGGLSFDKFIQNHSKLSKMSNQSKRILKKVLYKKFRSYLVHQAGLFGETAIRVDPSKTEIITKSSNNGTDSYVLELIPLLNSCIEFYDQYKDHLAKKSNKGTTETS